MVSELPLTTFVLETDAPDIPVFGKESERNSREVVPEIFESIVRLRNESQNRIKNQIFLNTIDIFPTLKDE